jgi:hypothetical protein
MSYGKLPIHIALKKSMQTEAKSSNGYLRCLVDADAHKWAQKIYSSYISDNDYSKFPSFLLQLDKLLHNFGAKANKISTTKEDDEYGSDRKKKKKRNRDRDE